MGTVGYDITILISSVIATVGQIIAVFVAYLAYVYTKATYEEQLFF